MIADATTIEILSLFIYNIQILRLTVFFKFEFIYWPLIYKYHACCTWLTQNPSRNSTLVLLCLFQCLSSIYRKYYLTYRTYQTLCHFLIVRCESQVMLSTLYLCMCYRTILSSSSRRLPRMSITSAFFLFDLTGFFWWKLNAPFQKQNLLVSTLLKWL